VEPSAIRTTPLPSTDFSPQASLWQRVPCTKSLGHRWLTRWARNPSAMRVTHTMASPAVGGGTAVTPRGQGRRHSEVRVRDVPLMPPFQALVTSSGTPPRSCAMSPPNTSPTMRWPNFTQPQAAGGQPQAVAEKHHPTSPSETPRKEPRVARRGTINIFKRS
jgi:hypothetical protein